jgi:hypothetical protein
MPEIVRRLVPGAQMFRAAKIALINIAVLFGFLACVELIFGNWLRPLDVNDLKRFSIPVDVRYEYDVSNLYPDGKQVVYHRDQYGLRGQYTNLSTIDVLTIGGSTTDQRFIDEGSTWQAVAARRLAQLGTPAQIANAGVDGQSMTGHRFDFENWFPLLPGLHPRVVVMYVGLNDVLKRADRGSYDGSLDADSWRVKSALWQLLRVIRGNLQAHQTRVVHGRRPEIDNLTFTDAGLLAPAEINAHATAISHQFVLDAQDIAMRARALGATPVFVTQSAFAWNSGPGPVRGVDQPLQLFDTTVNYADVSYLHKHLNAALVAWCRSSGAVCFDAASELALAPDDYYDYVHRNPDGARKFGEYLAEKLQPMLADGLPHRPR